MRLKLELEDFRFATTRCNPVGRVRWLIVHVNGKPFSVWREMVEDFYNEKANEAIDRILVEKMEFILQKIFEDACAAIPEGTTLTPEGK